MRLPVVYLLLVWFVQAELAMLRKFKKENPELKQALYENKMLKKANASLTGEAKQMELVFVLRT
jgi:hypothetical protein